MLIKKQLDVFEFHLDLAKNPQPYRWQDKFSFACFAGYKLLLNGFCYENPKVAESNGNGSISSFLPE